MFVKTITYQRVKNLGNFETERVEASAELEDGDVEEDVLLELRRFVNTQLDLGPTAEDVELAKAVLKEAGESCSD